MFAFFDSLSTELKLSIIRKLRPIPYVRLRRSNRFTNEFCEEHRRSIRIHPNDRCKITLRNDFFEENSDIRSKNAYFMIAYGNHIWDCNFNVKIDEENFQKIRDAISGFYFDNFTFHNESYPNVGRNELYHEALARFMQLTKDLHPRKAHFFGIPKYTMDAISSRWQLKFVNFYQPSFNIELFRSPVVRNTPRLGCIFWNSDPSEQVEILKLSSGKEYARIQFDKITSECRKKFYKILEDWRTNSLSLTTFIFDYTDDLSVYEEDYTSENHYFFSLVDFHIGTFFETDLTDQQIPSKTKNIKYDYWLIKKDNGETGSLRIKRFPNDFLQTLQVEIDLMDSTENFESRYSAALIVKETLFGSVLDLSSIYERLEGLSIREQNQIIEETRENISKRIDLA